MVLGSCIAILTGLLVYFASHSCSKPPASGWGLASHFTIPILSPFTSVVSCVSLGIYLTLNHPLHQVEHETSVMGTKVVIATVMVLAGLAYALVRYWLTSKRSI